MNILVTICARGGSKSVPGKNIKYIAGRPLLIYTISVAEEFAKKYNADIVLATDSEKIREVGRESSVFCDYQRPMETATDKAGKIDAIVHVKGFMEVKFSKSYDYVLDLDVTSPLRTVSDLDEAFALLKANTDALNIFSVSKAARNPYFNMVELKENGFYNTIKKLEKSVKSRQSAPQVFDMNASFYFYRKIFFDCNMSSALTDRSLIYEMDHICFDIDEPIDYEFMEYFLSRKGFNFFE